MRRILTAILVGALGLTASACAEVYHGHFGYGDRSQAQPAIPFDGGEITTLLDIRVNNYSGNDIAALPHFAVRNTSREDRCVVVTFSPQAVSTFGAPARIPVHVRQGRTAPLPVEIWAKQEGETWTWPTPSAYSTVATAATCR